MRFTCDERYEKEFWIKYVYLTTENVELKDIRELNELNFFLQILENESTNFLQSIDQPNNGIIRPEQGHTTHGQRKQESSGCCSWNR